MTTCDDVRPVLVEGSGTPVEDDGEIWTDLVEVDGRPPSDGLVVDRGDSDGDETLTLRHAGTLLDADLGDRPGSGRDDDVLHLHRLDCGDLGARRHEVALRDGNA